MVPNTDPDITVIVVPENVAENEAVIPKIFVPAVHVKPSLLENAVVD